MINSSKHSFAPPRLDGRFAAAQPARQGVNFYDIENAFPAVGIETEQRQVIDTTTWKASDLLMVKNIASYAELPRSPLERSKV